MLSDNDKLKQVLLERNRLIDQLDRCRMTKQEFHQANYQILQRWQMKPYPTIVSMEQGIYNYQYYNTMAKEYQRRATQVGAKGKPRIEQLIRNYFTLKDECIHQMLSLTINEPVECYFINTESSLLRNRLLEIVYLNREKVILHTVNPRIIQKVKRMDLFIPEVRISRIHSYINAQTQEVR